MRMGQHFLAQREGFSGAGLEIALTHHIERDPKGEVRGVVLVPKSWLEGRVSPGVYLVSVTDGKSSVRVFAEYRGDAGSVSWWYQGRLGSLQVSSRINLLFGWL